MEKVEDRDICAKCGGRCCKHGGCGYMPHDFSDMKFRTLKSRIDEGEISISCCLTPQPVLLLKSREVGKDIVNLFGKTSACAQLTPSGCKYSLADRPSEGAAMIPDRYGYCSTDAIAEWTLSAWRPHRSVMKQLVLHYTKKPYHVVLNEQIRAAALLIRNEKVLCPDVSKLSQQSQVLISAMEVAHYSGLYPFKK